MKYGMEFFIRSENVKNCRIQLNTIRALNFGQALSFSFSGTVNRISN
jgi:hypothetical protein